MFSPFEGGWGDVKSGFSEIIGIITKNIPLAPFKRGNCTLQIKISGKDFNSLPFVKQNLTVLPFKGEVRWCKPFLKLPLWIGGILLCTLCACHDKAALRQALIEETVQQKVTSHQRKKTKTCKEEAMREALIIADSVMIKLALSKVDTSGQGNRPVKPARPELDLPVDTTPIKPLFEDTIIRLEDTAVLLEKPKLVGKDTLLKDTLKK